MKTALTLHSRVAESRDVHLHVNGMPQAESHDQVTSPQLHTFAPSLDSFHGNWKPTNQQPFNDSRFL